MRKIASTLVVALLCFYLAAFAQSPQSVTGTVADTKGVPVPFVSIVLKGTTKGVTSDENGRFIIKAKNGDILQVSSLGFFTKEITVTNERTLRVTVDKDHSETLAELIVTAFEIKKSVRTTPFSAQTISADNLNTIRQPNLNNALAGKVAGVQFRGQSTVALDKNPLLRIRGGSTLNDDLAPIYVVDGTIVHSNDINPDDVESLNVLKGANATALFGGRAANGAIVITTRKKNASSGLGVELNSGFVFDKIYILPRYQNRYTGGANADLTTYHWKAGDPEEWKVFEGKGFPDYTDDSSWGTEMLDQEYVPWYAWIPGHSRSLKTALLTPQPNNIRDFWEAGFTTNNNISLSKSSADYTYRLSYTKQYVKGLLPTTSSDKNLLSLSTSYDINSHFTVSSHINYMVQNVVGTFDDDYSNASSGNFNQWFHRDLDFNILRELRNLRTPSGTFASWNFSSNPDGYDASNPLNFWGANYWNNPYTEFDQNADLKNRQRLFGDVSIRYKLNNHFYVKGAVRRNQLTTNSENILRSELAESATQKGDLASYKTEYTSYREDNFELTAGYNQRFGKIVVSAVVGGNKLITNEYNLEAKTVNGLNVRGLYAITNSKAQPKLENKRKISETKSVFATGDFEYNKFASLTWAVRSDWYSTLTVGNNRLISPSIGAGFVFSEFSKNSLPWLSFGKAFASWGKKPRDIDIYGNNFLYSVIADQWNGNFLMTTPDVLIDPELRGSLITTYEAGFDMRFLRNKLGVNLTYFNEDNDGEPVAVSQSGVSGYTSKRINAARIKKQGIEVLVTASPISTRDFSWDISMNYSYLINNPVVALAPGLAKGDKIILKGGSFGSRFAQAFQEVGADWGQLIGGGIARNEEGQMLVNPATGLYVSDPTKHWGSVVPKTNGGLINTLSYKNFTLGVNIDYQVGGHFFSLSEMWGHFSGLLEQTAVNNEKGNSVRNPVASGGGVRVVG